MRSRQVAMFATVLVTVLASMLAFSLPASAAGGTTIAGAPAVTPAVQQFGNTTAGGVVSNCRHQFWLLNVVAGDEVVVDWESDVVRPRLFVLPVGTTDFSFGTTSYFASFELSSNGKAQSTFTAPTTGAMPLHFRTCNGADGPYDFTFYVKHATVVSFQQPAVLARTGTLQVSVHNPDGAAITSGVEALVQVRLGSEAWATVGSAMLTGAPTTIGYTLPASYASRTAQVRVVAGGAGYLSAASATASIPVQGSTGPGPGSGGGSKVHVTLKASPKTVKRLHSVHLKGHATHAAGARVKIYQRQEGRSHWEIEGTTRVNRKGKFGYSEVIHQGSRYYRACVGSSCSRLVYVRFRA